MSGSLYSAGDTSYCWQYFQHKWWCTTFVFKVQWRFVLYFIHGFREIGEFLVIYLSSQMGKCFQSVGCAYIFIIITLNILQWSMAHDKLYHKFKKQPEPALLSKTKVFVCEWSSIFTRTLRKYHSASASNACSGWPYIHRETTTPLCIIDLKL